MIQVSGKDSTNEYLFLLRKCTNNKVVDLFIWYFAFLFPGHHLGSTMEIARSLFGPRAPQGYTDGSTQGQVHTAADDEEDTDNVFLPDTPEGLSTGEMIILCYPCSCN